MAINKIEYGDDVLIDLTDDTVASDNLLSGYTAHDRSGEAIVGSVTIPTKTSDLENDSGFITGMYIAAYGKSTYADILDAYQANKVVYCRASSNSNPASGNQLRMAFLAYVNNEATPTEFEFQYYRSVSSHTDSQQGDQVYVYKINKTSGWSITIRSAFTKVVAGTNMTSSFTTGINSKITLDATNQLPAQPSSDGNYVLKCTVSGGTASYSWEIE